jgi:hypothetical protein
LLNFLKESKSQNVLENKKIEKEKREEKKKTTTRTFSIFLKEEKEEKVLSMFLFF